MKLIDKYVETKFLVILRRLLIISLITIGIRVSLILTFSVVYNYTWEIGRIFNYLYTFRFFIDREQLVILNTFSLLLVFLLYSLIFFILIFIHKKDKPWLWLDVFFLATLMQVIQIFAYSAFEYFDGDTIFEWSYLVVIPVSILLFIFYRIKVREGLSAFY